MFIDVVVVADILFVCALRGWSYLIGYVSVAASLQQTVDYRDVTVLHSQVQRCF